MNRRGFLQILAGAAAWSLAPAVPLIPALAKSVENLRRYATWTEVIEATLRAQTPRLYENISRHNALLERLRKK